jgi:hypothetical protein
MMCLQVKNRKFLVCFNKRQKYILICIVIGKASNIKGYSRNASVTLMTHTHEWVDLYGVYVSQDIFRCSPHMKAMIA